MKHFPRVLLLLFIFLLFSTVTSDPLDLLPDYVKTEDDNGSSSNSTNSSRISEWTERLAELYWSTFGRLTPLRRLEHQIARYGFRLRVHYGWRNITGLGLHQFPRVCAPRIGCIQLGMTAENVSAAFEASKRLRIKVLQYLFLPFSPEKMRTRFFAYRAEAPDTEVEIVPTNASTFRGVVDPSRRVVVLTHGFTDHYHKEGLQSIKGSLLRFTKGEVGTVIMVDWHRGSYFAALKNFTSDDYYTQAVANTQVIGRQIADLVNELKLNIGLDPATSVYLVGHSLGAQTSSVAGRWGQKTFGWKVGRITGLDPAGPFFYLFGNFLKAGDAAFVDIIHTSAFRVEADAGLGRLGYPTPTADLDFFPNGGTDQPNCELAPGEVPDPAAPSCMHQSALWFYDATLNATSDRCSFPAYPADNYNAFLKTVEGGNLKSTTSDTVMGYWANTEARGARYLLTGKHFPYCLTGEEEVEE